MDTLLSLISLNIIPFLIILSLLVFVHEWGHYAVARYNGVKVEVFSIGFGPEIFGWTDAAKTRWKVCLVPLGGYVKMFSDLNPASQPDQEKISGMSEEEKSFSLFHKTVWQRMAVSVAGPGANYAFAILLFACLYTFVGQRLPSNEPKIGAVAAQSAASMAGIKADDRIKAINGQPVKTFGEMQAVVLNNPGKPLVFEIERLGEKAFLRVVPQEKKRGHTTVGVLGVAQGVEEVKVPFYLSPYYGLVDCLKISWQTLKSLGAVITRQSSADGLSGPIGIATLIGQAASQSWVELVWLSAFLSISLGLINLFPIPMLDGGHLVFYLIEAIRGKPVSDKVQEICFRVGFALVVSLMIFSTWNDLARLKVFDWFVSLF